MGTLNSRQFGDHGEQLAMFMSPQEIVDTVHKVDSSRPNASPAEQWDDIKDDKADEAWNMGYAHLPAATTPPLHIEHVGRGRGIHHGNEEPQKELWDGHHRLAIAQDKMQDWLPVIHHDSDRYSTEFQMSDLWGVNGARR